MIYTIVNIMGNGSFMVSYENEMEEREIIRKCIKNDLMTKEDAIYTTLDIDVDESEKTFFDDVCYNI